MIMLIKVHYNENTFIFFEVINFALFDENFFLEKIKIIFKKIELIITDSYLRTNFIALRL